MHSQPWWPSVRALIVLLHLIAVFAVACPAPVRSFNEKSWKRSSVQLELRNWSARLGQVGIEVTPAELQAFSSKATTTWTETRRELVAPFKAWLSRVGTAQAWYMFTGPDREPQRFVLSWTSTSSPTTWQQIFSLGDGVDDERLVTPGFVDDHRVRRALFQSSWSNNDGIFRRVCGYFDRQVRARGDDVHSVRCSLVGRPVEHPANRGVARPDSMVRELVIAANGTTVESRAGERPVTTKPKPKPRTKRQTTTTAPAGGAP